MAIIGPGITISGGIQFTPAPNTGIITSGLILNLDAGQTSSYSGSGNIWTDISSSGYNTTLYNSPTFVSNGSASYFNFTGSNQYGRSSYIQPIYNTTSTQISWNVWMQTVSGGGQNILIGSRKSTANLDEWNKIRSDGQYEWAHPGSQYFIPASISLPLNTWYNICYVVNAGNVQYYLNGSSVGNLVPVTSTATDTQPFYVGGDPNANGGGGEYGSGNVAIVQVYANTALTSTQVSTNFNAIRSRFGI